MDPADNVSSPALQLSYSLHDPAIGHGSYLSVIINAGINSVFTADTVFPHLFCNAFIEYISKAPEHILPCPWDLAAGLGAKTEPVQPLPTGVHRERPPDITMERPWLAISGVFLTPELLTRPDPDPHPLADLPAQPRPIFTEVPSAQGWGCSDAPRLPCSWWGGGTGLGCQALSCHSPQPSHGTPSTLAPGSHLPLWSKDNTQ